MLLALVAAAASPDAGQRLSRMTALYEEVCLKAFPDDKAVEALMMKQNARELTPEEVKVTMGDDPARGWSLVQDGGLTVWLEFPPFHACSVRWNAAEIGDLSGYRAIAKSYEGIRGGFHPMDPVNTDHGYIHAHATGEERILPDGSESLFIIDQHISDAKRRAAGETGVVVRFVHQIAKPPPELK